MKRFANTWRILLTTLFVGLFGTILSQPGGPPPGGGFPGRPPMGGPPQGREMQKKQQQSEKKSKINLTGVYKVSGVLKDSSQNTPLAYVNVALLNGKDSSFAKATTTDESGRFTLSNLPAGHYIFRATFIGYKAFYKPVTIKNSHIDLGIIRMQSSTTKLKGVTVKGERPIYSVDGEKTIYNVADDPSIQSGTTTDALQNAPGVEVDIEGNVTLRGVSSVEIWINDKPSKLTAENLKTYLEILPANTLDRIETITNPSAKYATEAEAVINIITTAHIKKNHFISFGANASTQPNLSPWISYVWANDKWSFNVYDGLRYSYRENQSDGYSVHRRDSKTEPGAYDTISQESYSSASDNRSLSNYLSTNINCTIDSMSDASLMLSINNSWNKAWSESDERRDESFSGGNDYGFHTGSDNRSSSVGGMFFADYSHKFDKKGHNMHLFLNGNLQSNQSDKYYIRDYTTVYNDLDQNKYYYSHSNSRSLGLSARYNRPYSQKGDLSYGLNANYSNGQVNYSTFLYDSLDSEYSITDPVRRYISTYRDQSVGGDANWTHRLGNLTLQLGCGVAYKEQSRKYVNIVFPDDTAYRFITANPSVHLSYRTKTMHNLNASYTLRTQTPSSSNMTLFRSYGEDSYSVGNRHLTPSYTHNMEAGWTKYFNRFGSVGCDVYGRFSTHEISYITDVTDEEDPYIGRIVSYSMPYNMGTTYRYGSSFRATYSPSGFFNLRFYANLYHAVYDMEYAKLGKNVHTETTAYSLRLNGWAKLFNRYQVHASARYSSPSKSLFTETRANYSVNCGVRSDFFKRKMSVYVNVQDIFNWGKKVGSGNGTTNPYYLSYNNKKVMNSRYISAGITFRFGKMELEKKSGGEEQPSE
ncbi:MAG: TonB-dependent receptor family protein [Bacteroidales bacterium]|nr:TonB-dependent receptor family protein [Bacteroidales bacterium]